MGIKKIIWICVFLNLNTLTYSEMITPKKEFTAFEVVKIQLTALKNNNNPSIDSGIKQVWLFAHPNNKKITGPYERFRIMIYGQQYRQLLNHDSHKINLIIHAAAYKHVNILEDNILSAVMNGMLKRVAIKIVMTVGLPQQCLFQKIKVIVFDETSFLFSKINNNCFCSLRHTYICYSLWCNISWQRKWNII